MNTNMPPFDDRKVRQALNHSIDKETISQLQSRSIPANGILPAAFPGYNKDLEGYEFDLGRAQQLLEESRYGPNFSEGHPKILLTSSSDRALGANRILRIFKFWHETNLFGPRMRQVHDHPAYLHYRDEGLQMFTGFDWSPEYPDPYYFLDPLFHSQGSENFAGYVNPELDRLLERARIEMNQESRIELYHRAEELILQDAPWIPLWQGDINYVLVKPNVKDYYLFPWAVPKLRFVYLIEPQKPALPLAPSLVTPASTQQPTRLEASGALNVTKTTDTNDGACDSDCSLREAIGVASSGDNIMIPAGIYTLTLDDQLSIDKDLTLIGAGSGRTIVQAAAVSGVAESRVFHISGSDVSISGVTVQNGKVVGSGGGILNDGALTLSDIIVRDNSGGGISNSGVITLTNTVIVNNSASYGGGIHNTGQATLIKTDLSDNSASSWGGGIFNNEGTMTLTNITINNNSAGYGGGIRNEYGSVTLVDANISYNSASSRGGGILNNRGTVTMTNTTISNNSASSVGSNIWNMNNEGAIILLDR